VEEVVYLFVLFTLITTTSFGGFNLAIHALGLLLDNLKLDQNLHVQVFCVIFVSLHIWRLVL